MNHPTLGCVQTDATTPNIVAPTMLGVVACVLAVVCKRMQQLQTIWGLQCIVGRIQAINLCKPCAMSVCGPNNVGRAVQKDPTLLRYASAITEQKKCWKLLAEKFDQFQTLRNNTQQHATEPCKRTQHVTSNNVASVCTGLYIISNDYDDMIYTLLLTNVNMYIVFVTPFMIVKDRRSKIGRRK